MAFQRIGSVSDLPAENEPKEFSVSGRVICVANVDGVYSAMDNVCVHRGGALGQGSVVDGMVVCPWHGWMFDPQTGAATHDRTACLPVYSIKIEGGDVFVDLEATSPGGE
jgi:nitrite reductase/ring-hydroxylating ferredoxin subunit